MENKVERIKVWKKNWNGKGGYGTETRIYIDMADGRRGGLFLTGNPYQQAGDIDGKLTQADIDAALELCGGEWQTMYEEEVATAYKLRDMAHRAEDKEETDHSFFSDFFGGERKHECCKCGATDNLIVVSNDSETYICQACQDAKASRTYPVGHDITEEAAREYAAGR